MFNNEIDVFVAVVISEKPVENGYSLPKGRGKRVFLISGMY
jgi:hypothetical protein